MLTTAEVTRLTANLRYDPLAPIAGDFRFKHFISMDQMDRESLELLFDRAEKLRYLVDQDEQADILKGIAVVVLMYQESTRTITSMDLAAQRVGAMTNLVRDPARISSEGKNESFDHSVQTYGNYARILAIRHKVRGTALRAAHLVNKCQYNRAMVINLGDGKGEHPTQACLDLKTVQDRFGRLSDLQGVVAGDLTGRTVRALLKGLSLYPGNEVFLLSTETAKLPTDDLVSLKDRGLKLVEITHISQAPRTCQWWYWTRDQWEYDAEESEVDSDGFRIRKPIPPEVLERLHGYGLIVTVDLLDRYGNDEMILMHPMPINYEIEPEVDDDRRAVYLREQMRNGLLIRMALPALMTGRLR